MGCGESREQKGGGGKGAVPWREKGSTSWNINHDQWKDYVNKTYTNEKIAESHVDVDGQKLRRELTVTQVKDEYVVGRCVYAHESFVSWGRIMVKKDYWESHCGVWISNDTVFGKGGDEEYKVEKTSDGTLVCRATGKVGTRDDVYLRFFHSDGGAGRRLGGDSDEEEEEVEEAAPPADDVIEPKPGKFVILKPAAVLPTASDDGKSPNLKKLKEGDVAEIVEIKRVEDKSRVRGKLATGGWISLQDFEGKLTWACMEAVAAARKEQEEKRKAREEAKKLAERRKTYAVWRLKGKTAEMNVSKGIDNAEDWKPCELRFNGSHNYLEVFRDGARVGTFKRQIPVERERRRYDGTDLVFGDNIDKSLTPPNHPVHKRVCLHMCKVDERENQLHIVYSAGRSGKGKPGSINVPIPPALMAEMRQYPDKWAVYRQPLVYHGRVYATDRDFMEFIALWIMMDIAITICCYFIIAGAFAAFEAAEAADAAGGAAEMGGAAAEGGGLIDFLSFI